jgi:hypothetical protein
MPNRVEEEETKGAKGTQIRLLEFQATVRVLRAKAGAFLSFFIAPILHNCRVYACSLATGGFGLVTAWITALS